VPGLTRPERGRTPQGEALATWAIWLLVLVPVVATYGRLDPAELYHVSNDGLEGGLSRAVVLLNFPIALVAIGLALVALAALPPRAWWVGGPAIVLCAVVAWPGVVDQDDLDVRWVNAIPATGVVLVAGLTLTAAGRAGTSFAERLTLDRVRLVIGVVALVISIPWLAAELGWYLPEGIWIMERPGREADGTVIAAVHLGHHHGLDGTLIALSALLLSRPRLRTGRHATVTRLYVSLAFAYGALNMTQDYWNEQLVKRGWLDWKIPSALEPRLEWVWLVILGVAVVTALALRRETERAGPAS
jgi:hypothetical protein